MAISVPILVTVLFCATNAFMIYARNRVVDSSHFPVVQQPVSSQSILIVSPHPDDESLGAAGLVQAAIRNHVPVNVVFLTCGDAFHIGVSRYYHEFKVKPADYIKYGTMREIEARSALQSLSLPPSQITFLGYPDQGLLPIFRQHWLANDPYRSPFSHQASVPYPDAFHPGAPFCGQSVTGDLEALIRRIRPTDIYVTHPSDDHPDHSAAPGFVSVALSQMMANGETWAGGIRVNYFLVHRGDWPVPQGLNVKVPLAPPAEMVHLDTYWQSFPLDVSETSRKATAIGRYASQQEMMGRFLTSFVRPNELFAQLPEFTSQIPAVSKGQITLDGDPRDWPLSAPFDTDATGDTVLRDFQSSGDIQAVYVCADDNNLYVRVDTHSGLSPQLHYNLYLRAFGKNGATTDKDVEVSFTSQNVSAGSAVQLSHGDRAAYNGDTYEVAIPISAFGAKRPAGIYIEAASMFSKLIVDRTGMRYGVLQPAKISKSIGAPLS